MSMSSPQNFIQEARKAGVITESNPRNKSDRKQPGLSVVPQPEADADNSLDNVNVTGAWSFDLKGNAPEQMKLYLIQKEDVVMGQGVIYRGNGTEKANSQRLNIRGEDELKRDARGSLEPVQA